MKRNSGRPLRVGTRGSRLALAQAGVVVSSLKARFPGLVFETVVVSTKGDRDRITDLTEFRGRGVFVKELEQALLDEKVDIAVHSLKDMPIEMARGLVVAAVPERAPVRDLFISRAFPTLAACHPHSTIGTGSPRRRAQIRWARPALRLRGIRGNLDTRLRKLRDGVVDALVVAEAGLFRLGFELVEGFHVQPLPLDVMLPAPGQGALALQIRQDDSCATDAVTALACPRSTRCVRAERSFLAALGGGCHQPIAALASIKRGRIQLDAMVAPAEETFLVRLSALEEHPAADPALIGRKLADDARQWLNAHGG